MKGWASTVSFYVDNFQLFVVQVFGNNLIARGGNLAALSALPKSISLHPLPLIPIHRHSASKSGPIYETKLPQSVKQRKVAHEPRKTDVN